MGDLYLWRQIFVLITTMLTSISIGNMVSFPSVLCPAILSSNNTDIVATKDQVTWIVTSNGIAGMFGYFILSPILQICGRKVVNIVINLFLFIGWIIFALAQNTTALLTARIIQGLALGGMYIHAMIVSEYTAPKRRGCFVTIKKATSAFGTFMCHALSLIWNWRQIAIFAITLPTLSMILTLFWTESPYYYALKGRLDESEKSFIWLYGDSDMQELHLLHSSQLQSARNTRKEQWYKFLFKKYFIKSFAIVSLLTLILELCGKHFFMIYVTQLMMELVEDKSLAMYFSIGSDLFIVAALLLSFFIVVYFKRRTILFSFGVTAVVLMLLICCVIVTRLLTLTWLAPALIILHCFIVNISIVPVCYVIIGEIFPLEYKGYGSCLSGIVFTSIYTLLLKLTPFLIENTSVGGVYAIYGIALTFSLFVLYYLLPETKDRILVEIENELKGVVMPMTDEIKWLQTAD